MFAIFMQLFALLIFYSQIIAPAQVICSDATTTVAYHNYGNVMVTMTVATTPMSKTVVVSNISNLFRDINILWITQSILLSYGIFGSRTTPHEDKSPPDKNKAQPLPTRTTIPRTIPHQDNSPLGPLPRNKTTHQDQNLYGGELSSWGVVRIRAYSNAWLTSFVGYTQCVI